VAVEGFSNVDVTRAHQRWGDELPEHLPAPFAVVAWDEARRRSFVAVDRLAAASVFVVESQGALLFATELAPLLRLLVRRPPVDEAAAVSWLVTGSKPLGATFFAGVRRLGAGEVVTMANGRISLRRYWEPTYGGVTAGETRELAAVVREGVREAVARRLSGGRCGIFLSGGLDSTSVAAAAVCSGASPLFAYTTTFPDYAELDESALVKEVAEALQLPVEFLPVRASRLLPDALAYLQTWHVPPPSPNLVLRRRLFDAARAGGAERVLDGEGGDELFAFAPYYVADLVRMGRITHALTLVRRFYGLAEAPPTRVVGKLYWRYGMKELLPAAVRPLVRHVRRRKPAVPGWLTERAARLLATADEQWAWKERDGPLWWRARVDELVDARQRIDMTDNLRRISPPELPSVHPFLESPDLVELMLSLPPEASFDRELNRPLLREANRGLLPDSVRLRRDKSFFDGLVRDSLEGEDRRTIEELLDPRRARLRTFVRVEMLHQPTLRDGPWLWRMWRSLALETWLRWLEDADFPAQLAERTAPLKSR
jgi:asparagine synthase (glutamine-hydrolysing)